MSSGGARPGAGRPKRLIGEVAREEILAEVERVTPPATLEALFADARAGDLRAFRMLSEIFDAAAQRALRGQVFEVEKHSKVNQRAAPRTAAGDLFGAEARSEPEIGERRP
jgi:hypothetical protein